MKKILTIALFSLLTVILSAQDYKDSDYHYYDGVEYYDDLNITSDQRNKIIEIKKNIGRRHAAIGKSGLRGYEKGQAHRKLNQEIRKEINDVLNSNQREIWYNNRSSSNNHNNRDNNRHGRDRNNRSDRINDIEDEIDDLEDHYDNLIDAVEDDTRLSKSEIKSKKAKLKAELRSKKRELKSQKQALKDSY